MLVRQREKIPVDVDPKKPQAFGVAMPKHVGRGSSGRRQSPCPSSGDERIAWQIGTIEPDAEVLALKLVELGVGTDPPRLARAPILANPMVLVWPHRKIGRIAAPHALGIERALSMLQSMRA